MKTEKDGMGSKIEQISMLWTYNKLRAERERTCRIQTELETSNTGKQGVFEDVNDNNSSCNAQCSHDNLC